MSNKRELGWTLFLIGPVIALGLERLARELFPAWVSGFGLRNVEALFNVIGGVALLSGILLLGSELLRKRK